MNQLFYGKKYALADYLQHGPVELKYCMENDSMIFRKLEPFLFTNSPDHARALANRGEKIFKDGPGAIGYYVGYRICSEYVKRNGKESWKDIYTLPVTTVFSKSGL